MSTYGKHTDVEFNLKVTTHLAYGCRLRLSTDDVITERSCNQSK